MIHIYELMTSVSIFFIDINKAHRFYRFHFSPQSGGYGIRNFLNVDPLITSIHYRYCLKIILSHMEAEAKPS